MTTVDLTAKLTSSCLQLVTQIKYAYPNIGVGHDSSVGIATRYGLDGSGIESRRGGQDFPHTFPGPGAHPASCRMGTGSLTPGGGKRLLGRGVDHPPHLVPRLNKE